MNTVKFQLYNELITEQHNIENAYIKFGLYQPLNLNIFITHRCQCDCNFCFDKDNNIDVEHGSIDYLIKIDPFNKIYLKGLQKSIEYLLSARIDFEFTITGGEPTLHPTRFLEAFKILKKYNIKQRTISTNGLNLLTLHKGKPLIQYLVDYGYTHNVSISRMSIDEELHDKIMGGPTISNKQLERIAAFSKYNDIELRVSMNLLKKSINSLQDCLEAVNFYSNIDINTILFRELQGIDNSITLHNIFNSIENSSEFKHISKVKSIFYDVDIYKYRDNNREFIVKCYQDKKPNKEITSSFSYSEGILREGFRGTIIKDFRWIK